MCVICLLEAVTQKTKTVLEWPHKAARDETAVSFAEYQKKIGEWGVKTFNSKREGDLFKQTQYIINHLVKEVDELREASLGCPDDIAEEAGDCFLILLHIAHNLDFDLLEEAKEKMKINYKRVWGEPDEFGVIEHVKERESNA